MSKVKDLRSVFSTVIFFFGSVSFGFDAILTLVLMA